jgi:chromosomal replication initiator protein
MSNPSSDGIPLGLVWRQVMEQLDAPQRAVVAAAGADPPRVHVHGLGPNEFTRDRLENRLRSRIEHTLSDHYARSVHLVVSIDPSLHDAEISPEPSHDNIPAYVDEPAEQREVRQERPVKARDHERLNPKYTFETFVIGESNRFAHAAAVAVAETPGKSYNPLLIYGPSGLGKTHLLHALGHYVNTYHQHLRVKYVSTEELTNDFINAISDNRTAQFRRTYDVDVLLIDDIQCGRVDRRVLPRSTLRGSADRHRRTGPRSCWTRWGSDCEYARYPHRHQPPDLETRIAILRRKASASSRSARRAWSSSSQLQSNIRELEGALIR